MSFLRAVLRLLMLMAKGDQKLDVLTFGWTTVLSIIVLSTFVATPRAYGSASDKCSGADTYWSVAFSDDGEYLAAAAEAGRGCFELWDTDGWKRYAFNTPGARVHSVTFGKDGDYLYLGKVNGVIEMFALGSKQIVGSIRGASPLVRMAISNDGDYMATGGMALTQRIFDMDSKAVVHELKGGSTVNSITFSPSGRLLAIGANFGLKLWDVRTGTLIKAIKDTDTTFSVRFTPDEREMIAAVGCDPGCKSSLRLVNLEDYSVTRMPGGVARQVAVTPNGGYVIVGGVDGVVKILDAKDFAVLRVVGNAGSTVLSMSLSRDVRFLAVGTWNGAVKVWDLGSNEVVMSYGKIK